MSIIAVMVKRVVIVSSKDEEPKPLDFFVPAGIRRVLHLVTCYCKFVVSYM